MGVGSGWSNMSKATKALPMMHVFAESRKQYGLGHVMRCMALTEEWASRGGLSMNWGIDIRKLESIYDSIAVIDGYYLFQSDERTTQLKLSDYKVAYEILKQNRNLVVVINEHLGYFYCDVFLNHCYRAEEMQYKMTAKLLLGSQYFLLKKKYRHVQISETIPVFDTDQQQRGLPSDEFAEKLASAKLVVCSAGTTVYEALSLGKLIVLRCNNDSERWTYGHLLADEYVADESSEGFRFMNTPSLELEAMRARGPRLIDGQGPKRVADALLGSYREML